MTLGEVCKFQGGTQPPRSTFRYTPDTGYVRLLQIRDFETDEYQTYVSKEHNLRYVYADDVLLARYGASVGKILRGKSGVVNVALMRAMPDETILSKSFLYYFLQIQKVQNYLTGLGGRSAQAGFNQGELNRIEISIPCHDEQVAIVSVLDRVKHQLSKCHHESALERERKAALTEYLFTHGTRGEPTKQTEIGEIPSGWRVEPLRSVADIRYGLGQPPELDSSGIPMIRATDIKKGQVLSAGIVRVKREAIPEARNPYLRKGDIIVVRSGAYTGDVAMYDGRWEAAVAGYDLVVSAFEDGVEPYFLSQFLLGEGAQRYFNSQSDRAAQSHLNAQQLGETLIPVPPREEQHEIGRLLHVINSKIEALEQEDIALDELFRAMLEELMTGRLSVIPLTEEHQTR